MRIFAHFRKSSDPNQVIEQRVLAAVPTKGQLVRLDRHDYMVGTVIWDMNRSTESETVVHVELSTFR